MKNPFVYGGVIGADAFCNRKRELADVTRAMQNGQKLFVYAERRMGKTSLVRLALDKLPEKQWFVAYVDLWPTDGATSFATATAKAIAESMSSTAERMLDSAKRYFARLLPSLTVDEAGKPVITFGIRSAAEPGPELEEALAAPARIAAERKRNVVVVFDECQQILEYGDDMVERRLRSVIQHHKDVSYIFLGSRKHLIQRMFLDKARPLYRSAGHYPLGTIDVKDWLPFIQTRFSKARKRINNDRIRSICGLTEGHPFYTQHLCHVLWELCAPRFTVSEDSIQSAVRVVLERESYAYATLWESLAMNQRRFLRGLAHETGDVKPFGSRFTRRWGLRSASNAQRAVEGLLERDVVDRANGTYTIVDRFFRIWVQRM